MGFLSSTKNYIINRGKQAANYLKNNSKGAKTGALVGALVGLIVFPYIIPMASVALLITGSLIMAGTIGVAGAFTGATAQSQLRTILRQHGAGSESEPLLGEENTHRQTNNTTARLMGLTTETINATLNTAYTLTAPVRNALPTLPSAEEMRAIPRQATTLAQRFGELLAFWRPLNQTPRSHQNGRDVELAPMPRPESANRR